MPVVVLAGSEIVRMLVAMPLDTRLTVDGDRTRLGGCLTDGLRDVLSETGPDRPFMLNIVRVKLVAVFFETPTSAKSTAKSNVGIGA